MGNRGAKQRGVARRCAAGVAVGALAGVGLTACGGIDGSATVLRVGDQAISKATVERWTRIVEHGGAFSGFRGKPDGSAKQRATALLVSSNWLIGEAARQGVPVEQVAVEEALAQQQSESAGFQKRLRAAGQTTAGLEFEMRAELAAEAVREKLAEQADSVSEQQLRDYYAHNRSTFSKPEVRVTDLIEGIASAPAATALAKRIGTAARFPRGDYHELVTQSPGFRRTPEKALVVNAIFAAGPGVISKPMLLNGKWAIFVVRRVIPPVPQPLAKVHDEVLKFFRAARQRELKTKFDREYTNLWRSRTTCRSGYVAPGCPQYHGELGAYEDPFSSRAHPALREQ